MFDGIAPAARQARPAAARVRRTRPVGGDVYRGVWHNVGTIEQLEALNQPTQGNRP
jgi:MurNAc alpha-1-phosphate uridylyltransferase